MAPTDAVEPLTEIARAADHRPARDAGPRRRLRPGARARRRRRGRGRPDRDPDRRGAADRRHPAGTIMDLTLGRRPNRTVARPLDRLSFRARFDLRVELARVNGDARPHPQSRSRSTKRRCASRAGSARASIARRAPPACPPGSVESYIRALTSQISVPSGLNSSDRFDIIIEHRRAATGETEIGQLLYAGLNRDRGRDLQLMQWSSEGRTQWFEASGVGRQSGGLQQPVPGPVTSNYGLQDAPDPRLFAHASRPRLPRRPRHADPRGGRRPRHPAPAGPAAMAARCGSATLAASPPPIRT